MIKLIKVLINLTIYFNLKSTINLANTIAKLRDSIICIFNMFYECVDDCLILICSIMWLYLFACIFSILEQSLLMFD